MPMPINQRFGTMRPRILADWIHSHRHTSMLIAIVALLGIRPLVSGNGLGTGLYSVLAMLLLVVLLYNVQVDELQGDRTALLKQRKTRAALGWALATIAILTRLASAVWPTHRLAEMGSISWLLFLIFVTITELRAVLQQKSVTRETISLSISVYLLMGLTWGMFFIMLFYLQPGAFSFGGTPPPADTHVIPVLVYFSLTTLATVGYGDITPLTLQARYASVAEGIAGQFYLAILVARLVGMQMGQAASQSAAADEGGTDDDSPERD